MINSRKELIIFCHLYYKYYTFFRKLEVCILFEGQQVQLSFKINHKILVTHL